MTPAPKKIDNWNELWQEFQWLCQDLESFYGDMERIHQKYFPNSLTEETEEVKKEQ